MGRGKRELWQLQRASHGVQEFEVAGPEVASKSELPQLGVAVRIGGVEEFGEGPVAFLVPHPRAAKQVVEAGEQAAPHPTRLAPSGDVRSMGAANLALNLLAGEPSLRLCGIEAGRFGVGGAPVSVKKRERKIEAEERPLEAVRLPLVTGRDGRLGPPFAPGRRLGVPPRLDRSRPAPQLGAPAPGRAEGCFLLNRGRAAFRKGTGTHLLGSAGLNQEGEALPGVVRVEAGGREALLVSDPLQPDAATSIARCLAHRFSLSETGVGSSEDLHDLT